MTKIRTIRAKMYDDIEVTSYGKPDPKLAAKLLAPIIQRIWLKQNGFENSEIYNFFKAKNLDSLK